MQIYVAHNRTTSNTLQHAIILVEALTGLGGYYNQNIIVYRSFKGDGQPRVA